MSIATASLHRLDVAARRARPARSACSRVAPAQLPPPNVDVVDWGTSHQVRTRLDRELQDLRSSQVDALSSALGSKPPRRLPMAPGGRPPELPAAAMEPPSSTPAVAAEVDALSSALGSKPPVGAAQSCKTQHCSSVLQRHWTSGGGTGGGGGSTGGKKGIDAGLMAMGQRGPESASQSMPNGAGRATWKVSSKEPQFTTVRWCLSARPRRQPNLWPDLGGDNVWTQGV